LRNPCGVAQTQTTASSAAGETVRGGGALIDFSLPTNVRDGGESAAGRQQLLGHVRGERDIEHVWANEAPTAAMAATEETAAAVPARRKKTGHFPVLSAVRNVEASVRHVAAILVRLNTKKPSYTRKHTVLFAVLLV